MAMAEVMSAMPDMWRRVLAEHAPDERGRCQTCRNEQGVSATWPCATYGIAEQAKQIHDGNEPVGAAAAPVAPEPRSGGRHAAD